MYNGRKFFFSTNLCKNRQDMFCLHIINCEPHSPKHINIGKVKIETTPVSTPH